MWVSQFDKLPIDFSVKSVSQNVLRGPHQQWLPIQLHTKTRENFPKMLNHKENMRNLADRINSKITAPPCSTGSAPVPTDRK